MKFDMKETLSFVRGAVWAALIGAALGSTFNPTPVHAQINNPSPAANAVAGTGLNAVGSTLNVTYGEAASTSRQGNDGTFPYAITSTVTTGTAPFIVASTTQVSNLNVSQLAGCTWAIPCAIGTTTPSSGAFTTLSATTVNPSLLFESSLSGATSRSYQSKFADIVSVKDFGALCDGLHDDTNAVQAALNSGALAIYVPTGTCLISSVTMPNTLGMRLYGSGISSILQQETSANSMIRWALGSGVNVVNQYIGDLQLNGANGTANMIDTSGVDVVTVQNIFVEQIAPSYSAVYVNGNNSVYSHDIRLDNIQIYSTTSAYSGIRMGPLSSDAQISRFIMNGNFDAQYCLEFDSGAQTTTVQNSHPYNALTNIVKINSGVDDISFNGDTLDNADADIVSITSANRILFTDTYFEAIQNSFSGVNATGVGTLTCVNCRFVAASTSALSTIKADSTSTNVHQVQGSIPNLADFTTPINLSCSTNCYAVGYDTYNPMGLIYSFSGITVSAQAQATTEYLGVNGSQVSSGSTAYVAPYAGYVTSAYVAVTVTPASGQTYTFTVYDGATSLATGTINNGSYSVSIPVNHSMNQYDQIYIQSTFSATSGSANIRYVVNFTS